MLSTARTIQQKVGLEKRGEVIEGGRTKAWPKNILALLEDPVLDEGRDWWDITYTVKQNRTEFDTTPLGKALIAADTAHHRRVGVPLYQLTGTARKKAVEKWRTIQTLKANGETPKKPRQRTASRKIYWSNKTWSREFSTWMGKMLKALRACLTECPRADRIKRTEGKVDDTASVVYGAYNLCSRCRCATYGMATERVNAAKVRSERFASYCCACKEKSIGHCLRCMVVDYLARARQAHGDIRKRDKEGRIVGLKQVPCYKECGTKWNISSLFVVDKPRGEGSTK